MSKKLPFYSHYITLAIFCQAIAFFTLLTHNVNALSSSLKIDCPTEIQPDATATCTVSADSDIEINKIFGSFSAENLEVSDFTTVSPWSVADSNYSFSVVSSSTNLIDSKIGTFKITPTAAGLTGTVFISNLVFENLDKYSFSVASPLIEIEIAEGPIIPTCADDEELVEGVCVKKCLEGEERIDGACVKKCAKDEERIDGVCTKKCADDEELIDGVCTKKPPVCTANEELVDGTCVPKVVTPTCKTGEILVNNKCEKKKDDTSTLIIIAIISAIILAGIITLIVVLKKRKKEEKESVSGSYLSTSGGANKVQTASRSAPSQSGPTPLTYDNSTYLARSSAQTQIAQTPKKNDDPKMQMQMQNSAEGMQRKQGLTSSKTTVNTASEDPNDPRLQIHFANKSEEMKLKPTEINPILVSDYQVATQSVPENIIPEEDRKPLIQAQTAPTQPIGPAANRNLSATPTAPAVESTKPVALSKPTTPDVFES